MTSKRVAAVVTALCGVASLAFMFIIGSRQKSLLLMVMFTVWVAAPFAVLLYALLCDIAWLPQDRVRLSVIALGVSLASAGVYGEVAFGPPVYKPASFFLIVPAASWVLLAVTWLVLRSGEKRS